MRRDDTDRSLAQIRNNFLATRPSHIALPCTPNGHPTPRGSSPQPKADFHEHGPKHGNTATPLARDPVDSGPLVTAGAPAQIAHAGHPERKAILPARTLQLRCVKTATACGTPCFPECIPSRAQHRPGPIRPTGTSKKNTSQQIPETKNQHPNREHSDPTLVQGRVHCCQASSSCLRRSFTHPAPTSLRALARTLARTQPRAAPGYHFVPEVSGG